MKAWTNPIPFKEHIVKKAAFTYWCWRNKERNAEEHEKTDGKKQLAMGETEREKLKRVEKQINNKHGKS